MVAWYDALALHDLADGAGVDPWPDSAGMGHAVAAGKAPTYQGRDGVKFNGTDQVLERGDSLVINNTPRTISVVAKVNDTDSAVRANTMIALGQKEAGRVDDEAYNFAIENDTLTMRTTNGNRIFNEDQDMTGGWFHYMLTFDGGKEDDAQCYQNNVALTVASEAGLSDGPLDTNNLATTIGAERPDENNDRAEYFNGNIAEVIVAEASLNAAERLLLHNYLAAKWNL